MTFFSVHTTAYTYINDTITLGIGISNFRRIHIIQLLPNVINFRGISSSRLAVVLVIAFLALLDRSA